MGWGHWGDTGGQVGDIVGEHGNRLGHQGGVGDVIGGLGTLLGGWGHCWGHCSSQGGEGTLDRLGTSWEDTGDIEGCGGAMGWVGEITEGTWDRLGTLRRMMRTSGRGWGHHRGDPSPWGHGVTAGRMSPSLGSCAEVEQGQGHAARGWGHQEELGTCDASGDTVPSGHHVPCPVSPPHFWVPISHVPMALGVAVSPVMVSPCPAVPMGEDVPKPQCPCVSQCPLTS